MSKLSEILELFAVGEHSAQLLASENSHSFGTSSRSQSIRLNFRNIT